MTSSLISDVTIRLHQIIDGANQTKKRVFPVSETRLVEQFNRRFGNVSCFKTEYSLKDRITFGKKVTFPWAYQEILDGILVQLPIS